MCDESNISLITTGLCQVYINAAGECNTNTILSWIFSTLFLVRIRQAELDSLAMGGADIVLSEALQLTVIARTIYYVGNDSP